MMSRSDMSSSSVLRCCIFLAVTSIVAESARVNRFIVGGTEVKPNSVPYVVSIQFKADSYHVCGGSILDETHILTSGSCCDKFPDVGEMQVVAGEHNLRIIEGTEQARLVSELIVHEDYDAFNFYNNICIVKLEQELVFDSAVSRAALPADMEADWQAEAEVCGWGVTAEGGQSSDVLMSATVPIVTDADCSAIFGEEAIQDNMLCAGGNSRDACERDSGSPLTCMKGVQTFLCGLASFGLGCSGAVPGVYTEVSHYVEWIGENVIN